MSAVSLTDAQRVDWLRLIRSERIGPRTFFSLLGRFGGAGAALEALPDVARAAGGGPVRIPSLAEVERELRSADRLGIRFIALGEADYPKPLQAIDTAPPLIAVQGASDALRRPSVAIVGSRNASSAGLTFAARLARELGEEDFAIVSGLARGVDASAHAAALATGTVAVLAGGHERIYPSENRPLLERILDSGGAVVSEMPLAWEPRGRDFPRRNRIVSGMSHGVVVVEAARRSGSLITARFALEQGREVFAVPGSPLDPRAEGANDLIRGGATLCATSAHVVAALAPLVAREPNFALFAREDGTRPEGHRPLWDELDLEQAGTLPGPPQADPDDEAHPTGHGGQAPPRTDHALVLDLLGPTPVAVDELSRQAELPVRRVQAVLVELELAGRLERHASNAVSLRQTSAC